jgi:hypothetical protein
MDGLAILLLPAGLPGYLVCKAMHIDSLDTTVLGVSALIGMLFWGLVGFGLGTLVASVAKKKRRWVASRGETVSGAPESMHADQTDVPTSPAGVAVALPLSIVLTILVIGLATAGSIKSKVISDALERRAASRRVDAARWKTVAVLDATDGIQIRICDDKPFALKQDWSSGGLLSEAGPLASFSGRQNRLIGSRIVDFDYETDPPSFSLQVKVDGSLFTPEEIYRGEFPGILEPREYILESEIGKQMRLEVLTEAFHMERKKESSDYIGIPMF